MLKYANFFNLFILFYYKLYNIIIKTIIFLLNFQVNQHIF